MENKNKFTNGPWEIHSNIGKKSEIGIVADSAPCIICTMGNQREWPMEAQANAALISAAPEMLKALRSALIIILDAFDGKKPNAGCTFGINKAIAKALGEA